MRAVRPGELVAKTIGLDEVGDELASMGRFAQEGVTVVGALAAPLGGGEREHQRRVACTLSRSTHSSGACRLAPIGP